MAELAVHAGGDHDTKSAATGNARSLEQHRRAIRDACIDVNRRNGLANSHRLAGERRLVNLQVRRLDQPEIRRHDIARFEQDDVSRNQALGRNETGPTVPAHPGRARSEYPQCLDGSGGLDLGQKADNGIERQNKDDGTAFLPFSEIECQSGGGREQSDDETLKLMNQDGNRADLLARAD